MNRAGWKACSNCEGDGSVDASYPDTGTPEMQPCGCCDGDGDQRCQHFECRAVADCTAIYRDSKRNLIDEAPLCWSCLDELAAEGRVVALIEWRDEPARVMDDVDARATEARWGDVFGRSDGIVENFHIASNVRDTYKISALLLRAVRFAAQEIENTNTEDKP
jgi:hypothetical protein